MRLTRTLLLLAHVILLCTLGVSAQSPGAPPVIQFFMPGGGQFSHELRFTLSRDDGRIETLYTDSKGKYSMPRSLMKPGNYTIFVNGDRQTYDDTTVVFRLSNMGDIPYTTVFLRPLKAAATPRAGVIDVATLDADVPAGAQSAYREGMEAIVKGQTDAGIESLKRAVSLHPQYLRALNDLGVVYMKINRLEEAADTFQRAIKISNRFAPSRLNLGITLNRMGKHDEAADLLQTLFKENPLLPGLRASLADALYDAGRLAETAKALRAGLAGETLSREERAELHYKLGRVLSREAKMVEAVRELRRATELEPTGFNAHLLLGGGLIQLKQLPEAERSLLRAYELGGARAGYAQLMLGQLYFHQQKFDLARLAFEQYLKDVPDARNAAEIRDAVGKLKTRPSGK
ncbi:MAG: tetratricopeptide repeat protein [Acidobacteria bacterium]|nr:tetratricopeptide repeat protein [Acidobacteriota bacterium]MCA1640631.1 tetratricopeptide repeat protein [Acidobacteriota bacterium]